MAALEPHGTAVSSIINLLATAMGGGLLSLPHAFADCGLFVGILFLACSGLAACHSLEILVVCSQYSHCSSFEANANFFLGSWGKRLVNISLLVLLLFACAAMCVIVMELAPAFLIFCSGSSAPPVLIGVCAIALMFPLSVQHSINILRYTSFVGLACIGYLFFCLVSTFVLQPGVNNTVVAVASPSTWFEGLPVMFSAYLCHFNILKIDDELRVEEKQKIFQVIRIAIPGIATVIYITGAFVGYVMLGGAVSDNILKDFKGDTKFAIAQGMLALTNMFKLPLLLIPLRESVNESIGMDEATSKSLQYRILMCFFLSALAFGLACSLQTLSKALGLLGCTAGVLISFVLPGLMRLAHLRLPQSGEGSLLGRVEDQSARRAAAWALVVGGLFVGTASLVDMLCHWDEA